MNNALAMQSAPSAPPARRTTTDSDDKNRGEVSRLAIELADNGGIMVRASFEPKKINPKFDRYSQLPEDEEMAFETVDRALAYIRKMLVSGSEEEKTEARPEPAAPRPYGGSAPPPAPPQLA